VDGCAFPGFSSHVLAHRQALWRCNIYPDEPGVRKTRARIHGCNCQETGVLYCAIEQFLPSAGRIPNAAERDSVSVLGTLTGAVVDVCLDPPLE